LFRFKAGEQANEWALESEKAVDRFLSIDEEGDVAVHNGDATEDCFLLFFQEGEPRPAKKKAGKKKGKSSRPKKGPVPPSKWSVGQVARWLEAKGFDDFVENFDEVRDK